MPIRRKPADLTLTIDPLQAGAELEETTMSLAQRLRTSVEIHDTAALEQAVADRRALGEMIARVEDHFEPLTKAANHTHRLLCDRRRDILAPLQKVDTMLSAAISRYKAAADREREAREQAESEQRRRDEQERAAAAAAALESSGQPELAASVLAEAIAAPAPVVSLPDATKDVSGLKFRRYWRWRFAGGPNDISATPGPVVARTMGVTPREFLTLDVKKITAYGNAMKQAAKIPGIEFYFTDEPIR
jgi:hypothetical protein